MNLCEYSTVGWLEEEYLCPRNTVVDGQVLAKLGQNRTGL